MSPHAFVDLLLRNAAAVVIVKATAVLVVASGTALAARRASAARRHVVWLAALVACAALALVSPVMPSLAITVPSLVGGVDVSATRSSGDRPVSSRQMMIAPATRPREENTNAGPGRLAQVLSHSASLAALVWIVGCLAVLVRYALGYVGAARLTRRARSVSSREWTAALSSAAAEAGVQRHVGLLYTPEVTGPVTFGLVAPVVLLPAGAETWSSERRRTVLVHELTHVARGDCATQVAGQIACALFWFHPLAWFALARLRDEAECATDDRVLAAGIPAVTYAGHLLELARGASRMPLRTAAVGMVATSRLERRFRALLDNTRSRAMVSSRARTMATSLAVAVVFPFASLRVAAPAFLRAQANIHAVADTAMAQVSTPQPASATRAATGERDTAPIPRTPEVRAAVVGQPAPEMSRASIAVVDHPAPNPVVHPDFSGKWTGDTLASPMVDFAVLDSTIITQSKSAISLESRSHNLDALTHTRFLTITFDGAGTTGVLVTAGVATNVAVSAVWVADTLVLKSYAQAGGHDALTYEQMTLSADGNTLLVRNTSFADGRYRWGGPQTFALRRMTP